MRVRKISVEKQARWRNFRLSYINGIRFTRDSHPQYIIRIKCSKLNFLALSFSLSFVYTERKIQRLAELIVKISQNSRTRPFSTHLIRRKSFAWNYVTTKMITKSCTV